MDDEDYFRPSPPSADTVARRALVLAVVGCRGCIEGGAGNPEHLNMPHQAYDWILGLGLAGDLSDWEHRVLTAPIGTLSERDRVDASWLIEAAAVLAWGLAHYELPAYDEQSDPTLVGESLGLLKVSAETVLSQPRLRERSELASYNGFILHLHWRIRDFSFRPRPYDFESDAEPSWSLHRLKFAERDVLVNGVPFFRATDAERTGLASITRERHRASNWLIGYESENFYETGTDT